MSFENELSNYMEILNCSINDICSISKISYSLVNRYINGKRRPKEDGKNFNNLVEALYQISKQKNINLSKESIYDTLEKALIGNASQIDFDLFIDNFNKLQDELSITTVKLSKAIGYDSSFVSRIKSKKRKPSDIENFIDKVRTYIIIYISNNEQKKRYFVNLLNCREQDLQDSDNLKKIISEWLCSKHIESQKDDVLNFLSKLNNFNLNDYVDKDFSKVSMVTPQVIFQKSNTYLGVNGRKQAEEDFLKTTLISKSKEPIFFYSDLPISETGSDEEFKDKWVRAMSSLLNRGLHLNMIHNISRSISEMLLGLENWIPIYMTGAITPYYFETPPSNFFFGSLCTSGSAALSSKCIKFNEKKSIFYLTTKKEEVKFFQEEAKYMLSKANPLMVIYKESDQSAFNEFIEKEHNNSNIQKIEKDIFKNINFYINGDEWVVINKKTAPEMHFVIRHEKLINAIKTFLLSDRFNSLLQ